MILISNICITILIILFLFIVSIKIVYRVVKTEKISEDLTNSIIGLLFILLLVATLPRLCIWLF